MRVWMSGEIMADVSDDYRRARRHVEEAFNREMDGKDFGASLKEITFIGILRPDGDDDYPEVMRYHKNDCEAEFRVKIDYERFRESDCRRQRRQVADALVKALERLPELGVKGIDATSLLEHATAALTAVSDDAEAEPLRVSNAPV